MINTFLTHSNIGIFNKCEVIEVFGYNKKTKLAFNIYTLLIFENTKQEEIEEMLTPKLQAFKGHKDLSYGIKRRLVSIEVAKILYSIILNENKFIINENEPLGIGKVKLLKEKYAPPTKDIHHHTQLSNILKNNFKNGSYILEFFDEEKANVQFLLESPVLLNEFSENVGNFIPIKIGNLSDRLGNIIFQFPINSFDIYLSSIQKGQPAKYNGIRIEITPKNSAFKITSLAIRLYEIDNDNLITRQKFKNIDSLVTNIYLDDCYGTHIEIIDMEKSLLLYKEKFSIIKNFSTRMSIIENQQRIFKINQDTKIVNMHTNTSNSTYRKNNEKSFIEWTGGRKYEQELKELEISKSFIQYFGNNADKAIDDARTLINKYGEKGIFIWDPYLNAIDIKNTLYYCKNTYVPMKAISGLKQHNNKEKAKSDMVQIFEEDDTQFLFLNLEVRGKIGENGYDFHDRFLIFPLEQPKVWSLGISINQLGTSHHILQEVKNAQHILNAFNNLWKGGLKSEVQHRTGLIMKGLVRSVQTA